MQKIKKTYNRELLDIVMKRDNATLKGEYDKLSWESKIAFICRCGNEHIKIFSTIVDCGGATCKDCLKLIMIENIKKTISNKKNNIDNDTDTNTKNDIVNKKIQRCFTIDLLNDKLKTDGAVLVGDYPKLTKESKITFICNCGEQHTKNILVILDKGGAICKKCTNTKMMENMKKTNLDKYGHECTFLDPHVQDKRTQTILDKYGVKFARQNEEINKKTKNTNLDKYGVECSFQAQSVKNKIKQTNLHKYGVEFIGQSPEIKHKIKQTNLDKYGSISPLNNPDIRKKAQNTLLNKFGYINVMQNPTIAEQANKNKFKSKDYTLPSGNILKIQGFEHFALNDILNIDNIDENDIINGCSNVPEIWYFDTHGVKRRHFVDIFIPTLNKCIEVKSDWTFEKGGENIFLKQQAAKNLGYLYEIRVYDTKGNLIISFA